MKFLISCLGLPFSVYKLQLVLLLTLFHRLVFHLCMACYTLPSSPDVPCLCHVMPYAVEGRQPELHTQHSNELPFSGLGSCYLNAFRDWCLTFCHHAYQSHTIVYIKTTGLHDCTQALHAHPGVAVLRELLPLAHCRPGHYAVWGSRRGQGCQQPPPRAGLHCRPVRQLR